MKRLAIMFFGLFALVSILSAVSTAGPFGIILGEDVSLSIKKIESAQGAFPTTEVNLQGMNLRSFNIGDSRVNPVATLDLYSVDGELVWWSLGSQNPTIIITIAKELFKGEAFDSYQNSAWLVTDDAFIVIQPSLAHPDILILCGFSIPIAKSNKNEWFTGQYKGFRSAYDAYLKYFKGASGQATPSSNRAVNFNVIVKTGVLADINTALSSGADPNKVDEYFRTPLMIAAESVQDPEVVNTLIKAGANVNATNSNGETPLMYAAFQNNNPDVLLALIKAGANLNDRDTRYDGYGSLGRNHGWTPLMYAASNNKNPEIILTLLRAGANRSLSDYENHSAFDLAKRNTALADTEAMKELGRP